MGYLRNQSGFSPTMVKVERNRERDNKVQCLAMEVMGGS